MLFSKFYKPKLSPADYDRIKNTLVTYLENAFVFVANNPTLSDHIIKAKAQFVQSTGKLITEQESYQSRIKSFLAWFLFNYQLTPQPSRSVLDLYIQQSEDKDLQAYGQNLKNNQFSLFLLYKKTAHAAYIENLFSKQKMPIFNPFEFETIELGSVFESRIYEINAIYVLGDYIVLHPHTMLRPLKREIKKIGNVPSLQTELLLKLQGYYNKWKTYKKVSLDDIYLF